MKAKEKFSGSILLGLFVFAAAMLLFISLPLVSYAETGTLGTESPEIYCTDEKDGVAVDGNELTAGTYDVSFVLTGAQNLSLIEITATYEESQVTVESTPASLISDGADSAFDSMGYILSDGNIVFGFVSTNEDCSSVAEDQVIATVAMTFASDCDAEEYLTVSENPNLTFAQADYGDGYDDSYALVDSYDSYDGALYLMTCDVTPAISTAFDVSGQIKIATDVTGTNTTVGIVGITVTVTDEEGTTIAEDTTDEDGYYTLASVPIGEYTMTISGSTTIDRTVTLVVSADKAVDSVEDVDSVGIVICDYNRDTFINATDKLVFGAAYSTDYNVYCDFNGDGYVNATDKVVFGAFYGETVEYIDIIL